MYDTVLRQAKKLLKIENFYTNKSTRYTKFFHTTLLSEISLNATQRSKSQSLREAYIAAQAAFIAYQIPETATRLLEAHQRESHFRREAGFRFESLSAFYQLETLEYARYLLEIDAFFARNPQEFLPFFTATITKKAALTPEQLSTFEEALEAYTNARIRFQANETPDTAAKMSDAYDYYVEIKVKLEFPFPSSKDYYKGIMRRNSVVQETEPLMAPLVHPRAVEISPSLRRLASQTDFENEEGPRTRKTIRR